MQMLGKWCLIESAATSGVDDKTRQGKSPIDGCCYDNGGIASAIPVGDKK